MIPFFGSEKYIQTAHASFLDQFRSSQTIGARVLCPHGVSNPEEEPAVGFSSKENERIPADAGAEEAEGSRKPRAGTGSKRDESIGPGLDSEPLGLWRGFGRATREREVAGALGGLCSLLVAARSRGVEVGFAEVDKSWPEAWVCKAFPLTDPPSL
jgi:hypothetical protein